MTAGQVHFRPGGRIRGVRAGVGHLRNAAAADSRVVFGHILPWGRPVVTEGELVWWVPDSVDTWILPPLVIGHGGARVGEALELRATTGWLDGWFRVDEGDIGDAVLDLVDRCERTPLSATHIAERGEWRRHRGSPPGVQYMGGRLREVALVPVGAFGADACLFGRTFWPEAGV